jgi:DNA polymerase-1
MKDAGVPSGSASLIEDAGVPSGSASLIEDADVPDGTASLVADAEAPGGSASTIENLPDTIRRLERELSPRWVWASTAAIYPRLLAAGVRVERCHDLGMTESLLRAHEERPPVETLGGGHGPATAQTSLFDDVFTVPAQSPTSDALLVATARSSRLGTAPTAAAPSHLDGSAADTPPSHLGDAAVDRPSPLDATAAADRASQLDATTTATGPTSRLGDAPTVSPLTASLIEQHSDQLTRIAAARSVSPGFGLLVAAESAAALAGVEMGHVGLPWRADVHDQVLTELLGERPRHGGRPPKLQALATEIAGALDPSARAGPSQLNIDSPLEVLKALRRQGILVETTRARELKTIDHPAIEPLLKYKELARLHVAHGWAWRDQWVREGRFKPEYIPGGVVTGRWATKGGGALQIPKAMRASVIADPGRALVVADAGQLEPRILAALSGDPGMIAATQDGDLYAALAARALGRPEARDETKVALLAAMYGARANSTAMAALRRRFPTALELLEVAARTGEDGGIVRSALGRTCPPPDPNWQQGSEAAALARSRARGRFTRNFVIQASAADWANVLVAGLRRRLAAMGEAGGPGGGPELVLFQHDEVVVHTPQPMAEAVIAAITESGAEATRLVVGERGVRIPMTGTVVASYADKH